MCKKQFFRQSILSTLVLLATTGVQAQGTPLSTPLSAPMQPNQPLRTTVAAPQLSNSAPGAIQPTINESLKNHGVLFAAPSITVKQIEVKPTEFPPVAANQYKVGFECTIKVIPPPKNHSEYPRYTCFIDQPRTTTLNALTIDRVDGWPSADGVTSKIVMLANKQSEKNPKPGRIRTAFQLMHETSPTVSKPVLKDFVYADGLLKK